MQLKEVSENYDRAAPAYDRMTDFAFGRLLGIEKHRNSTIDLLGDLQGATVLDIGCGTGRNFPYLMSRIGPGGRLIGVDYSEGMLARARQRVERQGWNNVELMRTDAATLEGVPGPVDAVVSVWCLGIVHDLDGALGGGPRRAAAGWADGDPGFPAGASRSRSAALALSPIQPNHAIRRRRYGGRSE